MKTILFASVLALSTAAIAQDTTPTPPAPDSTMPAQAPEATGSAPTDPGMNAPTNPGTPDATPAGTGDSGSMPATDSTNTGSMPMQGDNGISGGMSNMSSAQQQASSTDDSNLPACSASVTDKCVQKGGSSHHRMSHKHWKKK